MARAVGGQAHVSPLLLGLSPGDLDGVPMAMFQRTEFERDDVEQLLNAINAVAARPIPELAARHRDHPLAGTWTGHRKAHIEHEWLVNYRVEGDQLLLACTGSHSDLFRE